MSAVRTAVLRSVFVCQAIRVACCAACCKTGGGRCEQGGRDVAISAPNGALGVFEIDGVGQVNIITGPAEIAQTAPIVVVEITLLAAAFARALSVGRGGGSTPTASSGGETVAEAEEAEEEEEGDGIIASRECDGPPIRLC